VKIIFLTFHTQNKFTQTYLKTLIVSWFPFWSRVNKWGSCGQETMPLACSFCHCIQWLWHPQTIRNQRCLCLLS